MTEWSAPSTGGRLPHQRPLINVDEGPRPTGHHRRTLTPAKRAELVADITELYESDPGIALNEVSRRLAPKYGVSGSRIRQVVRDTRD